MLAGAAEAVHGGVQFAAGGLERGLRLLRVRRHSGRRIRSGVKRCERRAPFQNRRVERGAA